MLYQKPCRLRKCFVDETLRDNEERFISYTSGHKCQRKMYGEENMYVKYVRKMPRRERRLNGKRTFCFVWSRETHYQEIIPANRTTDCIKICYEEQREDVTRSHGCGNNLIAKGDQNVKSTVASVQFFLRRP